ncbi:MAG TPA: insulinase family protein [Leptolyngbyaceae cyanobacterium M33_DOE_097]|uniref:Insulinase family protein n=1 Tax=Oscillatoriales cyanobacterium SpSt-418 TaxID=2282169 RepID=A0A7C3PGB1_9CYAN|nr:insulinase family protein [Leptolyngbyaceae cyanobacterium M33_DOE_097]
MLHRRVSLFGLIFLFCLSVLLFTGQPVLPDQGVTLAQRTTAPSTPRLTDRVRKTVLKNGMTVLMKQVNAAPVVTVQVWYRVGSRNETPGINGIAHQLEHLLFKGTEQRPIQFGRLFSALGSQFNAFTSYDMTTYYGTVEQDKLDALLVLEADRMQNALINAQQLESEKRVVISELQGYENSPSYRLSRAVMGAAFPNNPYGLPVGGTKADVEQFTVEQVRDYYQRFYRPDNATLVLVGNFEPKATLESVEATFGQLTAPPTAIPTQALPTPATTRQKEPIVLRETGSATLIDAIYPLPPVGDRDVPALDVMDAILTVGRSSRIYQSLVETGLASDASGYISNMIGTGWYEFDITVAADQKRDVVDTALRKLMTDLQTKSVSQEELNRAKAQLKATLLLNTRDVTSQAFQLGNDQITTGDYQYTDKLLQAIAQVTAADVQRVARQYFAPEKRTVGYFEPIAASDRADVDAGNFSQTTEKFSSGEPVDPAEVQKYLPPINRNQAAIAPQPLPQKIDFSNGLQLLLFPDTSTPTVTLSGHINAGSAFDSPQMAGLASLTADNLLNGTQTKSALELAKELENKGADLEFVATREGVRLLGEALSDDLPVLVRVLADVLQNATFPSDEVELTRQQALTDLKIGLDTPETLARRVFQQTLYPTNHPFHTFPTEASLKRITREDMVNFYRVHYNPEATVLALVGNFDPAAVIGLVNEQLGGWEVTTETPIILFPPVPDPAKPIRVHSTLPGKTQDITLMGYSAISRTDSRYYAATVLNQILGGDTLSSRLGTEIRDRQGLTYGIYSDFAAGKTPGPFFISMQTAPEDTTKAINSTLALLRQLREKGVSPTEVAIAVRSLTSSYPVDLADPDTLAATILMNTVYGLNINELRQYNAKLEAVTPAQVNRVIQELLHPEQIVIVTAGPARS